MIKNKYSTIPLKLEHIKLVGYKTWLCLKGSNYLLISFKNSIHLQFMLCPIYSDFQTFLIQPCGFCSCFTTEILEGFDIQRTSGLGDTLRKYGYLTQAISQYYKSEFFEDNVKCSETCPPFDEFIRRCQEHEKMTVSDVFAVQLMQVLTDNLIINFQYFFF